MDIKELARFESKYLINPDNGCWEWKGNLSGTGYGVVYRSVKGKEVHVRAHRVSYEHYKGPIADGLVVRHMCHNRKCCNPDHLELGTIQDNNRDREESGRTAKGEKHYLHKRTETLIEAIKIMRRNAVPINTICARLDIGRNTYFRALREDDELSSLSKRARSINSSDAMARRIIENPGAWHRGEQLPQAKLTEDQVREIRKMRLEGKKLKDIGSMFGITEVTVSGICNGKTWKHVE